MSQFKPTFHEDIALFGMACFPPTVRCSLLKAPLWCNLVCYSLTVVVIKLMLSSTLHGILLHIVSFSIITLLHYHIYDCKLLLIYNCSLLHYYCIIIMSLLIIIIYYVIILSLHNWENYIKTEILLHNIQYNYVSIIASLLYDIVSS